MYGKVSVLECSSNSSASHLTFDLTPVAPFATCSNPLYVVLPESLLTDLLVILEVVFGARCTAFAPASWCWSFPANATDMTSACAFLPNMYTPGYFIVSLLPRLPSIHSTLAFS